MSWSVRISVLTISTCVLVLSCWKVRWRHTTKVTIPWLKNLITISKRVQAPIDLKWFNSMRNPSSIFDTLQRICRVQWDISDAVNGVSVFGLVDKGSQITSISSQFFKEQLPDVEILELDNLLTVMGAGGSILPSIGYVHLEVKIWGGSYFVLVLVFPNKLLAMSLWLFVSTFYSEFLVSFAQSWDGHGENICWGDWNSGINQNNVTSNRQDYNRFRT